MAAALAMVYVAVEDVPGGQGAESGTGHNVNAVHGVGDGLLLGEGDFPEFGYVAGGGSEDSGGEGAGAPALEGLEPALEGF